jgi:hypothetical protein
MTKKKWPSPLSAAFSWSDGYDIVTVKVVVRWIGMPWPGLAIAQTVVCVFNFVETQNVVTRLGDVYRFSVEK